MVQTRLDPLVRLREREEERARLGLARALESVAAARSVLERAVELARRDALEAGSAADWELRQLAHERALRAVREAEDALAQAQRGAEEARTACEEAHRRTEAVRRVAEARREEALAELDRQERKLMDEIGARNWRQ